MKRRKWRWDAPMGAPCQSHDRNNANAFNRTNSLRRSEREPCQRTGKPEAIGQASEFKVPFGLDDHGTLISRDDAEKLKQYRCPACELPLIFRQGSVREQHFAHKKDAGCSFESVLHKTAKKLVIVSVKQWKSGIGKRPIIRRLCRGCGEPHEQAIPETITDAIEEYRLPSGVRADVGLVSDKTIAALLEIFVTHSIDEKKRGKLHPLKWMEIAAENIISNPTVWVCRQESLLPFHCKICIERKRIQRKIYIEDQRIQLQRMIEEKMSAVGLTDPPKNGLN